VIFCGFFILVFIYNFLNDFAYDKRPINSNASTHHFIAVSISHTLRERTSLWLSLIIIFLLKKSVIDSKRHGFEYIFWTRTVRFPVVWCLLFNGHFLNTPTPDGMLQGEKIPSMIYFWIKRHALTYFLALVAGFVVWFAIGIFIGFKFSCPD